MGKEQSLGSLYDNLLNYLVCKFYERLQFHGVTNIALVIFVYTMWGH